ncbi:MULTISPECIES: hypothetical protein [Nocardiopsis]|uniref:Uncharacterized protein n=1 Tax=Nocardiopsis sinuspersici TaxID=501010 RepID=A0A1V3C792_9ACTN|nr:MULTISPECIES: hypothetical protein [Nocardiopsis]OOC56637.1 hypothetical protein NOSIN_24715 [Nocardiopsis sinuspersici]
MVDKRTRARVLLALVRRMARKNGLRVEELKGRWEGSHKHYVVGADGETTGCFGLTDHPRGLGRTVPQGIEDSLEHPFGEKWMEKS